MLNTPDAHQGFSLVELMVAGSLSVALLAMALHFHQLNARTLQAVDTRYRLAFELDRLLSLILREARRAGYRAGAASPMNSPPGQALTLDAADEAPPNSCLLYAYDRNGDGKLGIGAQGMARAGTRRINMEQFGFRLHTGHIQVRMGGRVHDCRSGRWETLTAPDVIVERFRMQLLSGPGGRPRLRVQIAARLGSLRQSVEGSTWLPNA